MVRIKSGISGSSYDTFTIGDGKADGYKSFCVDIGDGYAYQIGFDSSSKRWIFYDVDGYKNLGSGSGSGSVAGTDVTLDTVAFNYILSGTDSDAQTAFETIDDHTHPVTRGGTGLSACNTGDIIYGSGVNTFNTLSVGSDGYTIRSSGGVPIWQPYSHDTLSGISGGSGVDGYNHLTTTQHTWLADGPSTGYWRATKGGTDQNSYTVGDLLYADSATTLRRRIIGDDGYVLRASGGLPAWLPYSHDTLSGISGGSGTDGYKHFTTTQHTWLSDGPTSGVWVATKGGTNQTTWTTGDLLYASGTNTLAKRAIGSANQVLTVSGGVPAWSYAAMADAKAEYAAQMGTSIGVIDAAGKTVFANATNLLSGSTQITKLSYVGNGCVIASLGGTVSVGTPIYKSYDYGKTWNLKYSTAYNNPTYGATYVGGGYCFAWDSYLDRHIYSTNYGETWNNVAGSAATEIIWDYCRCGSDIIVAVGQTTVPQKIIQRSTNLGSSWSTVLSGVTNVLYCVVYCGGGIVVAGGSVDSSGYNIYRSTDYGATWTGLVLADSATRGQVRGLCYCGNGILVAATHSGAAGDRISTSTDYGATWSAGKVANLGGYSCCYMGAGRVLVGCGGAPVAGYIYESTDYGANFTSLGDLMPTFSGSTKYIYSLIKLDDNAVIMGCHEGYVCHSDESISIEIPKDETVGGTGNSTYTAGDMLYASAANTLSKLTIGTDGYYMKVSGTAPSWSRLTHDGLASISGGSGGDGYYHLTATQHTWLTSGPTTGYWTTAKGGTGFTTFSAGDLLYGNAGGGLSKLTRGTDGYILGMSGTSPAWKTVSDTRWQPLYTDDYNHTAIDNETIAVSNTHALLHLTQNTLIDGAPVRIFTPPDGYCALLYDGDSQLDISLSAITGVTNSVLNGHGIIYVSIIDEGGGANFHIDLYNDRLRDTNSKIAHTGSFNTSGSKALTADNGSGVGGTIYVTAATTENLGIIIECFKWYIVTDFDYTTNYMTLAGPELPTTASAIENVWIGLPEMVEQMDFFVAGNYATAASLDLLNDMMDQHAKWFKSPYRLVRFSAISKVVSATPPKINFVLNGSKTCSANSEDGITMSASDTWYNTSNNIIVTTTSAAMSYDIEISTTQGATTSTLDSNLTLSALFVSE